MRVRTQSFIFSIRKKIMRLKGLRQFLCQIIGEICEYTGVQHDRSLIYMLNLNSYEGENPFRVEIVYSTVVNCMIPMAL